jgi:S-DNA-T family DNA segregation ATPase FtsK/SpoIIIE
MAAKPRAKRARASSKKTKAQAGSRKPNAQAGAANTVPQVVRFLCLAAVAVLIGLSVYVDGSVGVVGSFIAWLLVGLIGIGAYALPVVVLISAVFSFAKEARVTPNVFVRVTILLWCFAAIVHLAAGVEMVSLGALFTEASWQTGGFLGGVLGGVLRRLLSSVGAYIVLGLFSRLH